MAKFEIMKSIVPFVIILNDATAFLLESLSHSFDTLQFSFQNPWSWLHARYAMSVDMYAFQYEDFAILYKNFVIKE